MASYLPEDLHIGNEYRVIVNPDVDGKIVKMRCLQFDLC